MNPNRKLIAVLLCWCVGSFFFMIYGVGKYNDAIEENTKLHTKIASLEELRGQHQLQEGRPINFGQLPDGNYLRVDDKHFAIVMQDMSKDLNPYFAIFAKDGDIPRSFAVKDMRKQVADFLKKNPPASNPAPTK